MRSEHRGAPQIVGSLQRVGLHTVAGGIAQAKVVARLWEIARSGFLKKLQALHVVFLSAKTFHLHHSAEIRSRQVSLLRRFRKPFQSVGLSSGIQTD